MSKTLEELEAYKSRLERDIRRSREIAPDGLSRHDPLVKNFEQVKRDIREIKESK